MFNTPPLPCRQSAVRKLRSPVMYIAHSVFSILVDVILERRTLPQFRREDARTYSSASRLLDHEQRPQLQKRGLVKRLREQIRNLFFGGHPVDRDHQVEIEFTAVAQPNLIVFGPRGRTRVDG